MIERENDINWESYFYPNSKVLVNNYGIKDYDELKRIEASESFDRLVELAAKPLDLDCGIKHLLSLHNYIFKDIYQFAGEYRTVNMTK